MAGALSAWWHLGRARIERCWALTSGSGGCFRAWGLQFLVLKKLVLASIFQKLLTECHVNFLHVFSTRWVCPLQFTDLTCTCFDTVREDTNLVRLLTNHKHSGGYSSGMPFGYAEHECDLQYLAASVGWSSQIAILDHMSMMWNDVNVTLT